jgi:hypothetical protein
MKALVPRSTPTNIRNPFCWDARDSVVSSMSAIWCAENYFYSLVCGFGNLYPFFRK